jgi:ATP-dependent DNA helicase Q1
MHSSDQLLSKMNQAGLLTRIAIDESHCCSQMGHDFRPDYKKLSQLRQFFPDVPIVALTATCGATVLTDVIRILGLKGCTPGSAADSDRTVFFSAPLYRANLHYSVVKKPSSAAAVITMMVEEILTKHKDQTGIVYCLSKADTEAVAKGLGEASEGRIRAGTYHAGMEDSVKQRIHESWRKGRIKVVCATIAFGSEHRLILLFRPENLADNAVRKWESMPRMVSSASQA